MYLVGFIVFKDSLVTQHSHENRQVIKKKLIEHKFVKDEHLRQILQMHHCKANETTIFFIGMSLITIVATTLSLSFYDFCIRKLQQSHLRKQSTLIHLSQSRTECTSLWRSGLCWLTSRRVSGLFKYVYKFVDDDKAHNQIYSFLFQLLIPYILLLWFWSSVYKSSVWPDYWSTHCHSSNCHQLCHVPWRTQLLWGKL